MTAGGGTRTHTRLPSTDFESASSTIPTHRHDLMIIPQREFFYKEKLMECREFEKLIPLYLNNSLDYESMERFRDHMNSCSACKEELSIQFLVQEGMKHLEKGDSFDLDEEFRLRLEQSRKKHMRQGALISVGQWVTTFILFVLGSAVIILFG